LAAPATVPGPLLLKQRALALAQPLAAHLELTYRCNWRCVFCYNPRPFDRRGLDGDAWIGVLADLRALGTLTVTLTGGEPLAHPDFARIATAARERALALRVFTNGSLVTDAQADFLAALRPLAVELSLHGGREETHDRTTGRPGSFTALLAGLDRLRHRGVPLLLKAPLTRLNEDEVEAMAALADEKDVPFRLDPNLTPRDDGDTGPLSYRASPAGIERAYALVARRGRLPHAGREAGGVNCGLGRITLAVDPEGDVFPCLQWKRHPLGNVRERPLREIWRSSPEREAAAAVAREANTRMLGRGGALAEFPFCPALAFERSGDPLTPDEDHVRQAEIVHRLRGGA
jgi:MoaA/NifB/PqqE/SkfB family radical SAM enzyme